MLSLLSTSKVTNEWILPLLYRSVTFWSADRLSAFWAVHNTFEERLRGRLLLVQHLWIGDTPYSGGYLGSTFWPVTTIHRILWSCTNLQSLYLINFDQNMWYRLEGALPPSLEHLAMGPVHGPLHMEDRTRKPRIRRFTSAQSFMRDDEVRSIILSPHMRQFRILFSTQRVSLIQTLGQVACISESETLEEIQFLISGPTPPPSLLEALSQRLQNVTTDKRVKICVSPIASWMELLFYEFQNEKEAPVGKNIQKIKNSLSELAR